MPGNIIVDYWTLNSVYFVITILVFIIFLTVIVVLFNKFQIEVAKELNTDCLNPVAIYFDKSNRDRCLLEKQTPKLENVVNQNRNNVQEVKTEITKTNQGITNAQNIITSLENSKELTNVSNSVVNISDLYYEKLYNPLIDMSFNKIPTMINNFKNKINESVQLAINVGNNLGNTIIQKSVKKGWNKIKEVDIYNNIVKYLNTVTDPKKNPNVDPEIQQTITNLNPVVDFKIQSKLNDYSKIKKKISKIGIISKI